MPELTPFSALRYAPAAGDLSLLLAPPYDVIDPASAADLRSRSDHNCVHLILPEGSLDQRYPIAAATLNRWVLDGVLDVDPQPSVYVYRQQFETDRGTGERLAVFAAVRLTSFEDGEVLPHERTHSGPKKDRLALTLATRTQLSPVFMVARDADGSFYDLARQAMAELPATEAATPDGMRHSLWLVSGERGAALLSAAGAHPLLIADGHHRYETALVASGMLGGNVKAAYLLACVVSQRDPGLVVRPTHRVLSRPPSGGTRPFDWIVALDHIFLLEDLGALSPPEAEQRAANGPAGSFILVPASSGRSWLAVAHPEALRDAGLPPERRRIAPVVFDDLVLAALYGLEADEASRQQLLSYSRSPEEAVASVSDDGCTFILPPVSLEDVWDTARCGGRLPPKSTCFEPKIPSGLLFRPL